MRRPDVELLASLLVSLADIDCGPPGQCALAADNLDEAVLLGTADGFVGLAQLLLRLAHAELTSSPTDDFQHADPDVRWTDAVKAAFFEFGAVWPVCAMVVGTAPQYADLKQSMVASGALPQVGGGTGDA